MRTRVVPFLLSVAFFLLGPLEALADRHKAGFSAAAIQQRLSEIEGFSLGGELTFEEKVRHGTDSGAQEKAASHHSPVSLVGGVGWAWGDHDGQDLKHFSAMVGPRFSYGRGAIQPYAQGLIGFVRETLDGISDGSLAGSFGWGANVLFGEGRHWGFSVGVDMFWLQAETTEWFPQLSVGFVYRVPHRDEKKTESHSRSSLRDRASRAR